MEKVLTNEEVFERIAFQKRLGNFKRNLEEKKKLKPLSEEIMNKFNAIKERLNIKNGF